MTFGGQIVYFWLAGAQMILRTMGTNKLYSRQKLSLFSYTRPKRRNLFQKVRLFKHEIIMQASHSIYSPAI